MPNEANKSKEKTGIVQKKKKPTMPDIEQQGTEGNTTKQSKGSNTQKGDTGGQVKGQSK
jgi:hypothetical protein